MHLSRRDFITSRSLLLIFSIAAFAQNPVSSRTLIRAGHVLDVHTGNEAADQTIVISADRITSSWIHRGMPSGQTIGREVWPCRPK